MHLLSAQAGALQQEGEAIDLAQTPGEIVYASSADSELMMLAAAADRSGEGGLRLANLMRLSHNLSVDLWIENTVRYARTVVLRLTGGISYFQYGVDELIARCGQADTALALISGDADPDPILIERSTVSAETWSRLHGLIVAGGPDNADRLLAAMKHLAAGEDVAGIGIEPFPRFGLWYPGLGMTNADALDVRHNAPPSLLRGGEPNYAPILFYRAALEGAGTATVEALIAALEARGLRPVPLVVSSLKEGACVRMVQAAFERFPPAVILNLTGFAVGIEAIEPKANPFAGADAPVLQLLQNGRPRQAWLDDKAGLTLRDLAMQVVLPEVDGRSGMILVGHKHDGVWHDRTQCPLSAYAPDAEGITCAATLAANWARLRAATRTERRIGIVLANYPLRDGRLANGVGYDAPQSTIEILKALQRAGYDLEPSHSPDVIPTKAGTHPEMSQHAARSTDAPPITSPSAGEVGAQRRVRGPSLIPEDGNALIKQLQAGPTNADPQRGEGIRFPLARYRELFATLPDKIQSDVTARWGAPDGDPFVRDDAFHLPALTFGNVAILLQPARGYERDDAANYHDPDLVPPHAYIAAYLWLRHAFGAHALIHNGKHGNLEWLPGKSVALDEESYPDALWGQLPHLYPFIVNDPGEGMQAKRRTGAVVVDHLVPPLTRAETYGPLKDLEALLDEYYAAAGMDRRRLADLKRRILDFTRDARLDEDIGLSSDPDAALVEIDDFLCDLKEAQIRDGLHILGRSPQGHMERDLIVALARTPRGSDSAGEASLIRALADDVKLGFDPLTAKLGDQWRGPPLPFIGEQPASLRTVGQVVEALETLAAELVEGRAPDPDWSATAAVLDTIETVIRPRLAVSGSNEIEALLRGLDGKFVNPGPSGAPSRGRLDVLPTGRNFYSVDNRAVPTHAAWELGRKSAENLILRHFQDHGVYLTSLALSVWGTANMRTGGDDIAQALALIGAKPKWDPTSLRLSGYEIIPLARLGRPRVDVTLRISGFFRDAFPAQIALFDKAARAVGALDEPEDQNPIAARMRAEALGLMKEGKTEAEAALLAGHRIFGSKPGAYGAGLQGLIDSGKWRTKADLSEAFLNWGQYAYGAHADGTPERELFKARLSRIEAVVHNQDNREHDILDSDDYYQFEGGLVAAAETLTGRLPAAYHSDHSRPERPLTRTLEEEVARVMRARVVNPKWIAGMMRHGYKGAFEIIATVDYMFAFAATTGAVKPHHFDLAFEAFVENETVRGFLEANNRFGYDELIARFNEARERGLWTPRSNSAYALLAGEAADPERRPPQPARPRRH
ncbi:cobaltochelatase subunit CobN [Devosia nitrariae]|uniref:Cobaltochelatase subunit CobN n=1 Tax=Devosia nitrariae TaxID=2071872 RepID=A0ABQ5VYV4_9HYPH|nr:cobaltochelatase subunit CobN [Devosia nitrariae]GLQ52974.1 cobaltochelatase subunit CobN [Devosia nitrariae]